VSDTGLAQNCLDQNLSDSVFSDCSDLPDSKLVHQTQQIMRKHAKSFDWAARFLAPSTRTQTRLLYAFARIADDLADEPNLGSLNHRLAALTALRADVLGAHSRNELACAVAQLRQEHALPISLFECFIDSLLADTQTRCLHTEQDLLVFAYGVAGTVGLMMRPILGAPSSADQYALALGIAMQLTNIARDVVEDAARGRIYIPSCYGAATHEQGHHPVDAPERQQAFAAITRVLSLADDFYAHAAHGLWLIPQPNRLAIQIALILYRGIGRKILRRGAERYWQTGRQARTHLNWLEKIQLTAPVLLQQRTPNTATPNATALKALNSLRNQPGFPLVGFEV
jgi:15-cis-phytoene synthase